MPRLRAAAEKPPVLATTEKAFSSENLSIVEASSWFEIQCIQAGAAQASACLHACLQYSNAKQARPAVGVEEQKARMRELSVS
ncbi:hypothetical protein [Herbaspirillum huttiense]|uniref:hypothetical protein n=1 Tax=Herbaspirillum huttiense TaxID=863372 RepID=UPI0039AF5E0B